MTNKLILMIWKGETKMNGGFSMKPTVFIKPNMANLHGITGKNIMKTLRSMPVKSTDSIRRDAEACKKRILARRTNEK